MTLPLGWARLWATTPPLGDAMVRQGAWYAVVSVGATRTVLDVNGDRVAVPNEFLEIRTGRPGRFTVVYRPRDSSNPARGTRADLGRIYAVCPASGSRVQLIGHPKETKCPKCGYRGEIAWWETG